MAAQCIGSAKLSPLSRVPWSMCFDGQMNDSLLRSLVLVLLDGGRTHVRANAVLDRFPVARAGERPAGSPHSAWQLLEHLRIAQADILQFCIEKDYEAPEWPEGYWPADVAPPSAAAWRRSVREFLAALKACASLVEDRRVDLLADLPHVSEVSWLQELFLIANHNSYHLGQLMLLRRQLEAGGKAAKSATKAKPKSKKAAAKARKK